MFSDSPPFSIGLQPSNLVLLAIMLFTLGIGFCILRLWSGEAESLTSKSDQEDAARKPGGAQAEAGGRLSEAGPRRASLTEGRRGSSFGPNFDPVMSLEITSLKESLLHAQMTGDSELECMLSIILAEQWLSVAELERAVRAGMQALEVARSAQDRSMEGRANEILARIYLQLNQFDLASKFANQALNVSKSLQNKKLEGEACAILVQCLLQCTELNRNQPAERKHTRSSTSNLAPPPARARHSLNSGSDRFQKSSTHARVQRQAKIEENISRALSNTGEAETTNDDQRTKEIGNMFVRRSSF
eukprot:749273-Hanusia_phi.AAC.2